MNQKAQQVVNQSIKTDALFEMLEQDGWVVHRVFPRVHGKRFYTLRCIRQATAQKRMLWYKLVKSLSSQVSDFQPQFFLDKNLNVMVPSPGRLYSITLALSVHGVPPSHLTGPQHFYNDLSINDGNGGW